MIASLPMYDRPANAQAHDRLWALIRDGLRVRGIAAPQTLDRSVVYRDVWKRPDLVLSHICVLPYRLRHAGRVSLIGASDYGLEGCPPGYFNAVLVVRAEETRALPELVQARFAANARHSQSGYGAAMNFAARMGVRLPEPVLTGAHDESVKLVASGAADFCFVDAQTWWMQQRDMPQARRCKVLHRTRPVPGQSFITRAGEDPAPYRAAVQEAIAALAAADRATLGLRGLVVLPPGAYDITIAPGVEVPA